ncbi:MAG: hypothetical protein KGN00_04625 [Chloroflexota bacterium]|nr:hypothetical protein [Chloroflexota bacterium]MDE3192953.1 hypothetical protein [Chloroflexota bacterium]
MAGRIVLTVIAAIVAGFLLFTAVVRPAVERGGWTELAFVVAVFVAVLLAERWARTR